MFEWINLEIIILILNAPFRNEVTIRLHMFQTLRLLKRLFSAKITIGGLQCIKWHNRYICFIYNELLTLLGNFIHNVLSKLPFMFYWPWINRERRSNAICWINFSSWRRWSQSLKKWNCCMELRPDIRVVRIFHIIFGNVLHYNMTGKIYKLVKVFRFGNIFLVIQTYTIFNILFHKCFQFSKLVH